MADMMLEFKVMPEGEVEYAEVESAVKSLVENYDPTVKIKTISSEPIGFGLQAVKIRFQLDENLGSEDIENKLNELEVVGDVEITLMDRL